MTDDFKDLLDFEIQKVLVLSTHHVSHDTFVQLNEGPLGITRVYEYGVMVFCTQTDPEEDLEDYPGDIKRLILLARQLDCQWLTLDRDGPHEEEITVFDW
jgi:hypothetical protein